MAGEDELSPARRPGERCAGERRRHDVEAELLEAAPVDSDDGQAPDVVLAEIRKRELAAVAGPGELLRITSARDSVSPRAIRPNGEQPVTAVAGAFVVEVRDPASVRRPFGLEEAERPTRQDAARTVQRPDDDGAIAVGEDQPRAVRRPVGLLVTRPRRNPAETVPVRSHGPDRGVAAVALAPLEREQLAVGGERWIFTLRHHPVEAGSIRARDVQRVADQRCALRVRDRGAVARDRDGRERRTARPEWAEMVAAGAHAVAAVRAVTIAGKHNPVAARVGGGARGRGGRAADCDDGERYDGECEQAGRIHETPPSRRRSSDRARKLTRPLPSAPA